MAFELREGQGSLFKNRKKTTANYPDMTGKLVLGGTTYWLSAWTKGGQNGKDKFLSLSVTEPRDGGERRERGNWDPDPDDLPF